MSPHLPPPYIPTHQHPVKPGNFFPAGTNVILFKSNDGELFKFSLALLAQHSPHFNEYMTPRVLNSFLSLKTHLPVNVASITLRLVFRLMTPLNDSRRWNDQVLWPNDNTAGEIAYFIMQFKMPTVGRMLLSRADRNGARWRAMAYFLVCVTTGEPYDDAISAMLKYGLNKKDAYKDIRETWAERLCGHIPVAYARELLELEKAHTTWVTRLEAFQRDLTHQITQTACPLCQYKPSADPPAEGHQHDHAEHVPLQLTGNTHHLLEQGPDGLFAAVWHFIEKDTMPWDELQVRQWATASNLGPLILPIVVEPLLALTQFIKPPDYLDPLTVQRSVWKVRSTVDDEGYPVPSFAEWENPRRKNT
ncbi:uncharacterized protein LOC62_04G006593 [Vanrija pseudolonga]|uniref:BTB domain-containing protein n=1 Tax=Vanrija pseudolonga TaxID=143232 RepID=A0AAF1BJT8_9TREE|nr:hypothetical protein LOC62_04G006593 [Vanrija pseudolonga]